MGTKADLVIKEAERINALCLPYAGEGAGGIGCSRFVRMCLYAAGEISKAELDSDYSMWAGQGIPGFFEDKSRFDKFQWSAALDLKKADFLYSNWYHVSIWDGKKGQHEATPLSHGKSANGKTGVGHFPDHGTYNCGTGTYTWTCVYRIKEVDRNEIIEKAIAEAEKIAADDTIGYCNKYPNNTGKDGYDCGAFISKAWELAGIFPYKAYYEPMGSGANYNLYNEKLLLDSGFTKNRYTSVSVLKRGDIVISGGHTVMYLGNNTIIHASSDKDGKLGDSSGKEICKRDWYENNWCYYFRYGEETIPSTVLQYGASGSVVKTLQIKLNEKLNVGLAIDGSFGPATLRAVKDYQEKAGLEVDGSVGPKTWASLYADDVVDEKEPAEEIENLSPTEYLEVALKVGNLDFGTNPERRKTLVKMYGEAAADRIQDIVDLAFK